MSALHCSSWSLLNPCRLIAVIERDLWQSTMPSLRTWLALPLALVAMGLEWKIVCGHRPLDWMATPSAAQQTVQEIHGVVFDWISRQHQRERRRASIAASRASPNCSLKWIPESLQQDPVSPNAISTHSRITKLTKTVPQRQLWPKALVSIEARGDRTVALALMLCTRR